MTFISRQMICFSLVFFLTAVVFAENKQHNLNQQLIVWNAQLDKWVEKLGQLELSDSHIKKLRMDLQEMREKTAKSKEITVNDASVVQEDLDMLGPKPVEDAVKESPNIEKRRKILTNKKATLEGLLKEADLVLSRIDKVLLDISVMRIEKFKKEIFTQSISPLFPEVWRKSVNQFNALFSNQSQRMETWTNSVDFEQQRHKALVSSGIALFAGSFFVGMLSLWVYRKFGRNSAIGNPSFTQSLLAASMVAIVRTIIPSMVFSILYLAVINSFEFESSTVTTFKTILLTLISIFAIIAVSRAMIAPKHSNRRLLNFEDSDARFVHTMIIGLAWVFGIDRILDEFIAFGSVSLELTIIRKFLVGLIITSFLLALLLRQGLWQSSKSTTRLKLRSARFWRQFRLLLAVLVLAIPLSAIFGYVALSRVFAEQLVLSIGLLMLIKVLRLLNNEFIDELLNVETMVGTKIQEALQLTSEGREMLRFWLQLALNIMVLLAGDISFLVLWGAAGDDLSNWINKALFGFKIGQITISISDIFLAVMLFTVALVLTRMLQRVLEKQVLPRTRLNSGIQHSIRAMIGYIGFIIATLVAISTLGLDLSKLAIIAGALSVGIGFGLQNVINNFVSGLILLAERPIKVGDWVVVGDRQGYVKKINVRATEITTFDRATVFVPNSNLISSPVLNWTHADKTGRVIIPLGVAYGSDTHKVREILLAIANDHPRILSLPAPSVIFKGFGNSALDFELRAFLQDVDQVMSVTSDLCFEINERFRVEGINIPFPQQDVHWKDIDRLEKLVESIANKERK